MTKLTLNNGEEIYESKYIIKEVKVFYERLYSERQVEEFKYSSKHSYADIAGKDFAGRGNYFS